MFIPRISHITSVPSDSRSNAPVETYRDVRILSAECLKSEKTFWNDLWERSGVPWATARAEQVALWLETFGKGRHFAVIVVREAGRWVLALPLIDHGKRRGVKAADLPTNEWQGFGAELMMDPERCQAFHWDVLVNELGKLPWKLLWLEQLRMDETRWTAFAEALRRNGWTAKFAESARYGITATMGDWGAYNSSRPEQKTRNRRAKYLESLGEIELTIQNPIAAADAQETMRQALEVEHANWKGHNGTSIIGAGMAGYYQRLGVDLARNGQLEITFLRLNGRPIATMISCVSKRICHNLKIGFDESYSQGSPGQVMLQQHYKSAFRGRSYQLVDDMGPMQPYTQIWNTGSYRVGQLVAARKNVAGLFSLVKEKICCRLKSRKKKK